MTMWSVKGPATAPIAAADAPVPGPAGSCPLSDGMIVICPGTETETGTAYLSSWDSVSSSVVVRGFTDSGYALAGTPYPQIVAPPSWCSTPGHVAHCPIAATVPGEDKPRFLIYHDLNPTPTPPKSFVLFW